MAIRIRPHRRRGTNGVIGHNRIGRYTYTGEELAESYINGNISHVKEVLRKGLPHLTADFIKALNEMGKDGAEIASRLLG